MKKLYKSSKTKNKKFTKIFFVDGVPLKSNVAS